MERVPRCQFSKGLHGNRAAHALPSLNAVLQIGKQRADDLRHQGAEVERLVSVSVVMPNAKRGFANAEVARRSGTRQPQVDACVRAIAIPDILVEEVAEQPRRAREFARNGLPKTDAIKRPKHWIHDPFG